MEKEKKDKGFVEKEKVRVIPTRIGEELHFTVVEVNGKRRGDIRFFMKNEEDEGVRREAGDHHPSPAF